MTKKIIVEKIAHKSVAVANKVMGKYSSGDCTATKIRMRGTRVPYAASLSVAIKLCESALATAIVSS